MAQVNFTKQKDSQTQKTNMVNIGEGGKGGIDQELGINRYKLLYIKQIKKLLLYSTGNYIQYPVINYNGIEYEKNTFFCKTESLCCTSETNTTL